MSRTILSRAGAAVGAAAALTVFTAAPATAQQAEVAEPSSFTSAFTAMGDPDNVLDGDTGERGAGTPGATGTFDFRINSDEEIICYDIVLEGVNPPYQSPADTSTHIHDAPAGESGPPRVVFPDPTDNGDGTLTSSGCIQGPFTTGVVPDGADTDAGEGFSLSEIEADPADYYGDTHTEENPGGAVRGQLVQVPVDGIDTGAGGSAASDGLPVLPLALGGLALAGAAGVLVRRQAGTEA